MQQQPLPHTPSNVSPPLSLLCTEVCPKPVTLSKQFQQPLEEEQENDASFSVNSADVHVHTPVLQNLFTPSSLARIKRESCSRPNFATNLVRSVFMAEERKVSNVRGIQRKQQLDPTKSRMPHFNSIHWRRGKSTNKHGAFASKRLMNLPEGCYEDSSIEAIIQRQ